MITKSDLEKIDLRSLQTGKKESHLLIIESEIWNPICCPFWRDPINQCVAHVYLDAPKMIKCPKWFKNVKQPNGSVLGSVGVIPEDCPLRKKSIKISLRVCLR